jgi:HAD superfamily hydrolase (TIGR01509 family)
MSRYKAILFDCDGVLIDTEPMGCEALAQAVSAAGVPMTREEATRLFSGNAAEASIQVMAGLGLQAVRVFAESDRILYEAFERDIPLVPGIESIVEGFDVAMAVCSNSSIRRLELSIGKLPLSRAFGPHVYSSQHVARGKPAPDLALFACEKLGVAPEQAIFIDDNVHGVAAARAAGCLAVGFVGPSDHRVDHAQTLRNAGADHVVTGMGEFRSLLAALSLPFAAPAKATVTRVRGEYLSV